MNLLANLALHSKYSTNRHLVQRALFSSTLSSYGWERPFLTSNRFLLVQNPLDQLPYLQLSKGRSIPLSKDMTVNDLEHQLKATGEAKDSARFIAPDGALIARSTKLRHLLHIPYFVMKLDGHREFNVMSEKSFSLRNQKCTLDADEKRVYDQCKQLNMRDQKAVEVARGEWTQNEILILIREVLAEKAKTVKEEKDILEQQITLLKRQREPMLQRLEEIEKSADRSARRVLWSFGSIFVAQFALIQYGTYLAFSWDIMEPITCGMTLGDVVCGYFFWMWTKRPYSIDGLREHFFERKKAKLIKKNGVDYDNYLRTEEAIKIIRNRLKELE